MAYLPGRRDSVRLNSALCTECKHVDTDWVMSYHSARVGGDSVVPWLPGTPWQTFMYSIEAPGTNLSLIHADPSYGLPWVPAKVFLTEPTDHFQVNLTTKHKKCKIDPLSPGQSTRIRGPSPVTHYRMATQIYVTGYINRLCTISAEIVVGVECKNCSPLHQLRSQKRLRRHVL
jgi:hypothetical protein